MCAATSTFGQPQASAFGSSQPAQSSGFSGFAAPTTSAPSAFGSTPAAPSAFGSSSFGQPSATPSAFGSSSAFAPAAQQKVEDPYNDAPKEEDLTAEVLAAFKASSFTWGSIPAVIPPVSVR